MTLLELLQLLKRSWKPVVALPVALTVVCLVALLIMPAKYQATSTVSVNGQLQPIAAQAKALATDASGNGVTISSTASTTDAVITVSATGGDGGACVEAANGVTAKVIEYVGNTYKDAAGNPTVRANAREASAASNISPSKPKYAGAAFLGGLFLAVVIVVLLDMKRQRARGALQVEGLTNLPLLADFTTGERAARVARLRAVLDASTQDGADSTVLLPVSAAEDEAGALAKELAAAPGADGFTSSALAPLAEDPTSLSSLAEAPRVALVIKQWESPLPEVAESLRDLQLAGANAVGFVLV